MAGSETPWLSRRACKKPLVWQSHLPHRGSASPRKSGQWSRCGRTLARLRNAHRDCRHASDYGGIRWIADMFGLSSRLWSRNQNQLTIVQFAPTANIAIAELEEENRTVM